MELNVVVERVKNGEQLSESDRLDALELIDLSGRHYSARELAQMLGVSERQIHRDRNKLRARYQQALKDLDLLGELHRQFQVTLARMDTAIAEGNDKRVRSLALRWGVCESFARLAIPSQLAELAKLIEEVRAKAGTDGHAVTDIGVQAH